jgi:hypothetical protein
MWFALCADGTLSVLGDHGDYEAADAAAEDLGLDVVWLVCGDDAAQWANTINSKNKQTYSLYKSITDNCNACGIEKPKSSMFKSGRVLLCCQCMIKDLQFKEKAAKIFS